MIPRDRDRATGVVGDQTILLTVPTSTGDYPHKLRRIKYHDAEINKTLVFLSNDHKNDLNKNHNPLDLSTTYTGK